MSVTSGRPPSFQHWRTCAGRSCSPSAVRACDRHDSTIAIAPSKRTHVRSTVGGAARLSRIRVTWQAVAPMACGCLVVLLGSAFPRIALLFTWLFTDRIEIAFDDNGRSRSPGCCSCRTRPSSSCWRTRRSVGCRRSDGSSSSSASCSTGLVLRQQSVPPVVDLGRLTRAWCRTDRCRHELGAGPPRRDRRGASNASTRVVPTSRSRRSAAARRRASPARCGPSTSAMLRQPAATGLGDRPAHRAAIRIRDDDLLEWDYGDFEGLTTVEIREEIPGLVGLDPSDHRRGDRSSRWAHVPTG